MIQLFHSMTNGSYFKKITKIESITKDVVAFYFEKDKNFSFLPGQYIEITIPEVKSFPTREFTISSSPLEKDFFRIVTKKGESAFKKAMFKLKAMDAVSMAGPKGGFILHEEDIRERIFISGGLGITPFYSMILFAAQKGLSMPITLFASFKNEKDILFSDEFENIYKKNKKIRVVYTLTGSERTKDNREKGRITKELLRKYVQNLDNTLFLIAGPNQMVDDMQEILAKMQIPSSNIRVEYFNGYDLVE